MLAKKVKNLLTWIKLEEKPWGFKEDWLEIWAEILKVLIENLG